VSSSTASIAFSGAGPIAQSTRSRVRAAPLELGYDGPTPLGRSLRSGRSGIVAVVSGDHLARSFRDPVSIQVPAGLVGTLGTLGSAHCWFPPPPRRTARWSRIRSLTPRPWTSPSRRGRMSGRPGAPRPPAS